MSTPQKTSEPRFALVVGLDASPDADRVLESAIAFARGVPGSELHLVYAVDPPEVEGFLTAKALDEAVASGRTYLDRKAKEARLESGVPVIIHVPASPAGTAIIRIAASIDADLVMVGTHDRKGISRWALGSVAERVVSYAGCPVLVVRPKRHSSTHAPEIEPPCADCLHVQRETKGAKLWCARHAEHHPHAHLHYEIPQGFGEGSSIIRP